MMRFHRLLLAVGLLSSLAPLANADRIITMDGRQIVVEKAREEGDGYRLEFASGTIILPDRSLVKAVEVEGDMSDYEPKDDRERDFLEKGYVRYRGKWMSKRGYQTELDREAKESRELAEEAGSYADWGNALEGESKYFRIRTNTSPELLEYYGDLLDTYYKMMNKRIGIKPSPTMRGVKLRVNIYKNREEFTKITQMSPGVAGFFMPMGPSSNLNFYHDYEDPSISQWVGLHECTHLLTYLIDQQFKAQIWINEAMADYYGSSTIEESKSGKLSIEPGKLQTDRVLTVQKAIEDGKAMTLEELFKVNKSGFDAFQYAHAWSFVYFLNNGADGKYEKGFGKFFKELYNLKGVVAENVSGYGGSGMAKVVSAEDIRDFLLKKIKVDDVEELQIEWLDYVANIPIDAPEARLKRGLRNAMMGDFAESLEDLTAAIDEGVMDPRAFATRARGQAMKFKMSEALADIDKAIAIDPLKAEYYFDRSHYLLEEFSSRFIRGGKSGQYDDEANIDAARKAAGLAASLDPDNRYFSKWSTSLAAR